MASGTFLQYANIPSAVLSDGILTVPLWAVSTMSVTSTFYLPAIGGSGAKATVSTHDTAIKINGVLVGEERYAWKLLLETMADSSKRGSALGAFTGGRVGGLVLITSMTIRTDMQFKSLVFTNSAAKRDALDVEMQLEHMPLPSALGKLLDAASVGVGALADWGGN